MRTFFSRLPTFLLLALALGIVARAVLAFATQFWLDELWSVGFSHPEHSLSEVIRLTLDDVHPPLFQMLLHYWLVLFGFTEASARAFSLLVGILASLAFIPLAQSLYEKKVAMLAASLFALNIFAITYSAEVRSYQLLLLFGIINTTFLFQYLYQQKRTALIAYIAFSLLAIYTHYFGVILLFSHAVIWLGRLITTRDKSLFVSALITYLLLFVLWTPLLSSVLADVNRESFWISNPSFILLLAYILIYFGGPLALPFLFFPLMALKKAWPECSQRELFLLLAALSVLFVPYLIGFVVHPILNPRNAIIGLPYWILLIAFVANFLPERRQQFFIITTFIVNLIGVALVLPFKGEEIDRVLEAVQKTAKPVYLVHNGELDTQGFLQTKIDLNRGIYPTVELNRWQEQQAVAEQQFWLICYHKCEKMDLFEKIPDGYSATEEIEGRGIKAILLNR